MASYERVGLASNRRRALFVLQAVAASAALDPGEMLAPTRRNARVALGRQVAIYLSHVSLGMSLRQVAMALGRDRTTAAHACRVVEERREDARFDAWVQALEGAIRSVPFEEGPDFYGYESVRGAGRA